ncbi:helix-turn-helix transcriptional regulator [Desulfofundulus sp. TPOSR]|uniref:helix-turn-helix transcriptional regulator n=1 Tax=Desulfofundulus sp. TPOSR TaxID=2714340 RepID=UPI0014092E2E|nr:helix-turn-helix transcriptional regulator [Desulfofundulus sp. TPOSR]NHM28893.1 helix-turn-helix transcriptional regulator [Desulfofundulus sp. TPOSR]
MGLRHNLIKARTNKNLKQVDVARYLGLAKSTYCEIEHGHHNPSWEVAQRLEKFFGIPAGELLAISRDEAGPGGE